jgi:ubiquinone/menaquinone biosynthesis C-methylase UbiE
MSAPVDYDRIAAAYEGRYERNDYSGVERALKDFVEAPPHVSHQLVLEIGCGTGHWQRFLDNTVRHVAGLDLSRRMLQIARARQPDGRLVRARAEALPCLSKSVDRIFCVNALHHFSNPSAFFSDASRVLREGGGLMIIGLDPHAGGDEWWIYDYFPAVLVEDRRRYLPARQIRELMADVGLSQCVTQEVQHRPAQMTVGEAARRGFLDRTSTSQLMLISEAEYNEGMTRLNADDERVLRSDLRIYGTTGWAL